ncbi:nicotinate phosphoribosyltransferase [Alkalilimnicola sp. S0819]|uniref:nicotinate phosphoribosyltransferase n=1 Tax=Alkalilimnicola sp. S0819 TaxID=2613922 RepID=UPI001262157B|nr:nicotinate phosphoribosyltransferase [Alkalilimnicola sp. S0819]KAB7624095.1 nicotinate phosphoribosyltransferase [Alkalilimnicola sp. S0819]MPQ16346.1 nicotinate phosphoribosyltransferase [Alkalilimnicola sp. S0819]
MTRREASPTIPALFTDLYELTMAQACLAEGLTGQAVFSLFVRRLPPSRNYLLACGLETVLDYLQRLRFTEPELAYLASLGRFSDAFLDWLRGFRFTGTVHAVAEGTPVFANEPILELSAALPQAQLVETCVMNQIHVQTVLGSKAQRMVSAARGRPVIDFGARRTHGVDAALKAARAFHIAGVSATSNLLAGERYGVPVAGTMAHSYIQAHDDEAAAFRAFTRRYPDTVLLVDTYDTLAGVDRVIALARELSEDFRVSGVRLDSGELDALARETRARLDRAGLGRVKVIVSGGLDEWAIAELRAAGAPIDGYGVGTSMGVAPDAPDLDIVYKLCEYAGEGRLKLSPGKPILPGRKQVFRQLEADEAARDVIARADETLPGEPLLAPVMRDGERLAAGRVSLEAAREHAREALARLPAPVRGIAPAESPYPVAVSERLAAYHQAVEEKLRGS